MPKQTFFNLSTEKQDTLIQAAKKEFSRVALHEASIANIIKEAEIPRGSFYQYFEGKEDLYYYLLNQMSEENNKHFMKCLKEREGDIFETFIDSFQLMVERHKDRENKNFFKNAFLNMNYKVEDILASNIYEENQKSHYLAVIRLVNLKNLNLKNEEEIHHVFKMMMAITFQNLIQVFVRDLTSEEAMKNYVEQIEILKRGLSKKEKNV